jgi:hypothetical protein
MDDEKDDKNLVEKTIETVKHLAQVATDAAKHAMDTKPDTERVAETANEQVYMPTVPNATAMPLFAAPAMKKRKAPVKPAPAKVPPKNAPKKTAKAAAKKTARKSAAKKPAKKVKAKSAVKKPTAKKGPKKKKAKKSRR